MLIGEGVYILYIPIDKRRNSSLNYLQHCCFFGEKYYSDDEILVIIGDVSCRMGTLNDSTCFTLND